MLERSRLKRFSSYVIWRATIAAMIASVILVNIAMAASGDIDPEFQASPSLIHTRNGFSSNERNFVALQSDGRIIVAGNGTCNPDCDILVLRHNSDGTPDLTFALDGFEITDLGRNENVGGMAIQSDDKIVVSGSSCDSTGGNCRLFLARYTPDGILDNTFQDSGVFNLLSGDTITWGQKVAIRPNGKIVVLAAIETPDYYSYSAVYQFNPDGSLDYTFGSVARGKPLLKTNKSSRPRNGFAIINMYGNDLAIQPDGMIVVSGSVSDKNYGQDFGVARLLENGDGLDKTFGKRGIQITDFGGDAWAHGVAIGSDGKIILAGYAYADSGVGFGIARYNPNGSLDTTFHGTGFLITDVEPGYSDSDGGEAWDVLVQADQKIVAVGYKNPYGSHHDIAVVRYNSDGSLDTAFGSNGIVAISYYTKNYGASIVLQPDGKYVVAGLSYFIGYPEDRHYFTLDRILP